MSMHKRIIGAAMLFAVAIPLGAQERGTVEFGAFGSYNMFEDKFQVDNAIGVGGRVATFLHPRLSLEFEGNGGSATRPLGLADRTFMFIDARLIYVPIKIGRASLLVGAGGGHADVNVNNDFTDQSYGMHLLLGGKFTVRENAAIRVDAVQYFNSGMSHSSLRAGLSLYRHPRGKETTVYQTTAGPSTPQRPDSVSAAETRRLRMADADYKRLRDSLALVSEAPALTASNVAALATMLEMIHFERDEADLDEVSRAILLEKVPIFNANPEMRIVITGYASQPGTEEYNLALGLRRATAAKAFLVSQGVADNRIEITTRGEQNLRVDGPGDVANAANRRGQFRLLIANPYLVKP